MHEKWQWKHSLSSGEKVALSVARLFSYWHPNVRLIVSDECDSVLDHSTRWLFFQTLYTLSQTCTVYYVSHSSAPCNSQIRQPPPLHTTVFAMGCTIDERKGYVVMINTAATPSGTGQFTGTGNVGRNLLEIFSVALRSVTTVYPEFSFLKDYDYHIDAERDGIATRQLRSATLSIAIGLINIARIHLKLSPYDGVAATGNVRIDGTIEPVRGLASKVAAAQHLGYIKTILTPEQTDHLREVLAILSKTHATS